MQPFPAGRCGVAPAIPALSPKIALSPARAGPVGLTLSEGSFHATVRKRAHRT